MIGMPEQRSLDKDREQEFKRLIVGSMEGEISLNPLSYSFYESREGLGTSSARIRQSVERFEDNLSFLSIRSAIRGYPDTGESGDAYDAEAFR
jgi:hypothetical protein